MLFTEVIQPTENILNNFSVFLFFVPFLNTEKDVSTKTFPKNWDSQRYLLEPLGLFRDYDLNHILLRNIFFQDREAVSNFREGFWVLLRDIHIEYSKQF